MRASQFTFATLKEIPSDADIVSSQLMIRAGLIRKLASGLYTWLPMGLRTLKKVQTIIREEMDAAGAQELLMPVTQPAELWQESRRFGAYGPELLRFQDRHQRAGIDEHQSSPHCSSMNALSAAMSLPLDTKPASAARRCIRATRSVRVSLAARAFNWSDKARRTASVLFVMPVAARY